MKPLDSDEDESEQLSVYQKELRQRANQSIQQLSSSLQQLNPDGDEEDEDEEVGGGGGGTSLFAAMSEDDRAAWSQKTQSEAVNQLKSLLLKQCREIPPPLSPSKKQSPSKLEGRSSLPAYQDLVPVIYNQSEYIQHLEAEVKLWKEEMQEMKQRVRVVVVENEKLQSQMKSKAAEESLKDYTIHNSLVKESVADNSGITSHIGHGSLRRAEHTAWKNELEQLKVIYQAQVESLEAQVISLRKDLSVSQKECEEVKVRLRHREKQAADALKADGAPRVSGLCLQCAQHEAVLAGTHTNLHVQAIDRLTKERDELLGALRAVRTSQQEAQQREWSACLQVKQAVEMAEEANLHKHRVEVQFEQLSRELTRQREKLEQEAQSLKERLSEAREEGRTAARKQIEEMAHTVTNLSQRVAELEGQLDRTNRDKSSLTNQLEDALRKLTSQEQDNTKMTWFCWFIKHRPPALGQFSAECEMARMRPWSSTGKGWSACSRSGRTFCLEWRSSSISGSWSCSSLRNRVRLSDIRRLLHVERGQLRWLGHLVRTPPGVLGMSNQEETPGKTQDTLERLCLKAGLGGTPRVPPWRSWWLVEVAEERRVWASFLRLLPCDPDRLDKRRKTKMKMK